MTSDQKKAVLVFSWLNNITVAVVTGGVLCFQIAKNVTKYFKPSVDSIIAKVVTKYFRPLVDFNRKDANPPLYRNVDYISAYIPQVQSKKLLFPIVCCDMSAVPLRHYPSIINDSIGEATDPKVINNKTLEEVNKNAYLLSNVSNLLLYSI
jgi:hypothetical protein